MVLRTSYVRALILALSLALGGLTSCVSPFVEIEENREAESVRRDEIVQSSLSLLGKENIEKEDGIARNDCSGFVVGVYRSLGYHVELEYHNTQFVADNLYRNLRAKGKVYYGTRPRKADLAFFRSTVENSGNRVTHVGLVADIESDDTIVIVHYSSQGVSLMRMNLQQPHVHRDEAGKVLNDFLRKKAPYMREARLLSGELFFMYGDLYRYITD